MYLYACRTFFKLEIMLVQLSCLWRAGKLLLPFEKKAAFGMSIRSQLVRTVREAKPSIQFMLPHVSSGTPLFIISSLLVHRYTHQPHSQVLRNPALQCLQNERYAPWTRHRNASVSILISSYVSLLKTKHPAAQLEVAVPDLSMKFYER